MLLVLGHVPLTDVKFEESCIEEVNSDEIEAELEGELEASRNVHASWGQTDLVRSEGHHSVTTEKRCVEDQACDVIQSLVQQDLLP